MTESTLVLVAVVGARFLLPLTILRYPLPGIVACLVLDGLDQTIFQALGYDPPGYQGYDKAMDVFYLAMAYLATMRNWDNGPAFEIARGLYFYRLIGVVIFEFTQARPLLLVFCNTFEYYFIAYEVVRLRWSTRSTAARFWLITASAIWVGVKLPQEYWLHVAQLDVTDVLAEHAWARIVLTVAVAVLAGVLLLVVAPRLPAADHHVRVRADTLPAEVDTAEEQTAWIARHGRVWSTATAEKMVLVGLLAVVYAFTFPSAGTSRVELFFGVAVIVLLNAAVTIAAARRAWSIESIVAAFLVRTVLNVGTTLFVNTVLGRSSDGTQLAQTFFYLMLIALVTTLHDRYRPVLDHRGVETSLLTSRDVAFSPRT